MENKVDSKCSRKDESEKGLSKRGSTQEDKMHSPMQGKSAIPKRNTRSTVNLLSPCTNVSPVAEYKSSKCFICNKKTFKKDQIKFKIQTPQVAKEIQNAAKFFQDEIFNQIAHLRTAEEVLKTQLFYHGNCMRSYLKQYKKAKKLLDQTNNTEVVCESNNNNSIEVDDGLQCESQGEEGEERDGPSALKKNAIKNAINELMSRLRAAEFFTVTEIREQVSSRLAPEIKMRNRDIQRIIEDEYGDMIGLAFPKEANKPAVIFHKDITIEDLVNHIHATDILKECAEILRQEFLGLDFGLDDKHCDALEINDAWTNTKFPKAILSFFAHFFKFTLKDFEKQESAKIDGPEEEEQEEEEDMDRNGEENRTSISHARILKLKSLMQIIYYNVHNGRKKTPLHLLVAFGINAVCKSSSLIKGFNRLGIGQSYDGLQRVEARMATQAVQNCQNSVPLPTNFDKTKFTVVAFDNFDHLGSAQFGVHSTHDTLSVGFQTKSKNESRKPLLSETNTNVQKRTFDMLLPCQSLKEFEKPKTPLQFPPDFRANMSAIDLNVDGFYKIPAEDMAWYCCRMDLSNVPNFLNIIPETQNIPSWNAFHSLLSNDKRPIKVVGFFPILPYPVTEYSTVFTAMCNFLDVLRQLDQQILPVFCDEGVYRIAKDIQMRTGDTFKTLLLMLGNFHSVKIVLCCIGKYVRGSGIETLLIDTGYYGVGTAEQVFNGTNYARSLKAYSYLNESLRRLQIEAFFRENPMKNYAAELEVYRVLQDCLEEKSYADGRSTSKNLSTSTFKIISDFELFVRRRCEESPLFKYWNNFLLMYQLVLNMLKADRTGDWDAHVKSIKQVQIIYFMMNRVNYIRGSGRYLQDIIDLEHEHPEVYEQFKAGNFVVKQTNSSFTSIPTDQALETTGNRSKKNPSGIVGCTERKAWVTKWELIHPEQLAIFNLFRKITGLDDDNYEFKFHHENSPAHTKLTEEIVQKMIKFLKERCDPFSDGSQPLRNIYTQEVVAPNVSEALTNIFEKGYEGYRQFFMERFVTKTKTLSDKITKINVPLFKPLEKPSKKTTSKNNEQNVKYAQRLIDLAKLRGFSLEELFTYELIPQNTLFNDLDDLKYEIDSKALLNEVKKNINCMNHDSEATCLLIDVSEVCRSIQWKPLKTFGELFKAFCTKISQFLSTNDKITRMDFIFAAFNERIPHFVKKIGQTGPEPQKIHEIIGDTPLSGSEGKFWSSEENVFLLQEYFRDQILENSHERWPLVEVITSPIKTEWHQSTCRTRDPMTLHLFDGKDIHDIASRMIYHIEHATRESHQSILLLATVDDDMIAMCLYYWDWLEQRGLKHLNIGYDLNLKKNQLAVHVLAGSHSSQTRSLLPAIHYLTGSKYTSRLTTKRKALISKPEDFLSEFGRVLSDDALDKCLRDAEKYLIGALKTDSACKTFDELRCWQYRFGKTCGITELPPTSANMYYHILRALYQTHSRINLFNDWSCEILEEEKFGYMLDGDDLIPRRILELYPPIYRLVPNCTCTSCVKGTCLCRSNQVACCNFCKCHDENKCKNPLNKVHD